MALLRPFLAIFLSTTFIAFIKLRFCRSFQCAQSIKILIGSKGMTSITIFALFPILEFCKKKNGNLQLMSGHFTTISGHFSAKYNKVFHKTEVPMVVLMCFVYLYLNWIKSYNIILVKNIFFHASFQG